MAFDSRDNAKTYEARDGDTLQSIADRETAEGNPITWQQLAKFNWGTDDPAEVNAFLRDELGTRKRDTDNNFAISTDDEPQGTLVIPKVFTKPGLAINTTHTLRVRKKDAPPQFLECCHLPGVTFATASSFIRPSVVGYLKKLQLVADRHPDAKIMIFGHTDAVADDLYNKKLSERRAWSAYAFITNDSDVWESLYNHPDEEWGLEALQDMLADLGYYDGKVDGDWGPKTRDAFCALLGVEEGTPVQNDAATRKDLFDAYMASKHDIELEADRFVDPGYMGCGEFNRIHDTEGKEEENRRVTFVFVHPDRIPTLPCAFADIAPCQRQFVSLENRHKPAFRCSFYDSLLARCKETPVPIVMDGWVSFEVDSEKDKQPMPGVKYTLELPDGRIVEGQTGSDGNVKIENIPEGMCILRLPEFHAADWDADEDGDLEQAEFADEPEEEESEAVVAAAGDSPFLDDDPDDLPDNDELGEI